MNKKEMAKLNYYACIKGMKELEEKNDFDKMAIYEIKELDSDDAKMYVRLYENKNEFMKEAQI